MSHEMLDGYMSPGSSSEIGYPAMTISSDNEQGEDALRPVTPKEAAVILNCNLKSVYQAMGCGEIPCIKIGRLRFIPRPAFERLLRDGAAKKPSNQAA
jgi:excisionase family DNA binding protein